MMIHMSQIMDKSMTKSYIWPLVNRLSHVLLVVFFVAAYFLGDFDDLLSYHVAFGYALGVVFIFRTLWGFIGPKHSRFKDFNFNLSDLKDYMFAIFSKTKEYVGHNPASSWAVVAMIIVAFLTIITGTMAYGIEEHHGVLSFLYSSSFKDMEIFKDVHELLANLFIAIIGVHILGSLIDKYIKKSDAIDSMVSGYKKTTEKIEIKLNIFQKLFSIIWIIVSLFSLYYLIFTQDNIFIANSSGQQNYTVENEDHD